MKRRDILKLGLTSSLMVFGSAFRPLEAAVALPYGSTRLENTDKTALQNSLLQQMRDGKIPEPETFIPFPVLDIGDLKDPDRAYAANYPKQGIIGDAPSVTIPDAVQKYLTIYFKNEPPCQTLVLKSESAADHVYAALHETAHYIAQHSQKQGTTIEDYVFRKINRIEKKETLRYISDLAHEREDIADYNIFKASERKSLEDKLLVTWTTSGSVADRIADASAVLYSLSNYTDTKATLAYCRERLDIRQGLYIDERHNTASSMQAAMDTFAKTPRKGMSIVECTQWAADIIVSQPEFTKSIDQIADDIRQREAVLKDYLGTPPGWHIIEPSYENEKRRPSSLIKAIVDARNRACGIEPK